MIIPYVRLYFLLREKEVPVKTLQRSLITLLMLVLLLLLLYGFGTGRLHISPLKLSSLPVVVAAAPADTVCCDITGMPTVRAAFINRVLSFYHSPASGTGQALYDLSQQYHINDVYALAVFKHESLFGRAGMAHVTLSLGNIRCSVEYRCINGYRAYNSWQAGYADWYHLIATAYIAHGLTTIPQIIPVYAPASDGNDVTGYIADVEQSVMQWQKGGIG